MRDQDRLAPSGICPVCAGSAFQTLRYPRALCVDCKARATDLSGRAVRFSNVSFSGGFIARHYDDGTVCPQVSQDHRVLVDGAEHRADEARFGGTLVQPLD